MPPKKGGSLSKIYEKGVVSTTRRFKSDKDQKKFLRAEERKLREIYTGYKSDGYKSDGGYDALYFKSDGGYESLDDHVTQETGEFEGIIDDDHYEWGFGKQPEFKFDFEEDALSKEKTGEFDEYDWNFGKEPEFEFQEIFMDGLFDPVAAKGAGFESAEDFMYALSKEVDEDDRNSVLAMYSSPPDIDKVENLIKFRPTKEEMELLKNYKEMLGKCEQGAEFLAEKEGFDNFEDIFGKDHVFGGEEDMAKTTWVSTDSDDDLKK